MKNLIKSLAFTLVTIFALNGCAVDPTQNDPNDPQATVDDPGTTERVAPPVGTNDMKDVEAWDRAIGNAGPSAAASCSPLGTSCSSAASCCSGGCTAAWCSTAKHCCAAQGQACQTSADCCQPAGQLIRYICSSASTCVPVAPRGCY